MKFAANTGFLFKELPFLERIGAAARAGFDAVEFHDEAQREDLDDVRAALREAKLPLLGLNARMGDTAGCAAIDASQAREDVDMAIDMALALGGSAVHVLGGRIERNPDALDRYHESLRYACERAAGLTILIEPLCTKAMPGYVLSTLEQAARTIETVDHDALRIMFDIFHVVGNGDDPIRAYRDHRAVVGHVQIADPVTRAEPNDLAATIRAIVSDGYEAPFGAEYVPTQPGSDDFEWMSMRAHDRRGFRSAAVKRDG